jgi:predicted RNase H-like HicB family nuclease
MKPSDRYLKIVQWSEEDGCYVGTCPGLMLGGVHGPDEAKVYRELCRAVDEWIQIQDQDHEALPKATAKRNYSGKLVVRLGKELHKDLAVRALQRGESLNTFCVKMLRRRSGRR